MKIGLLIDDTQQLQHWHLRIIKALLDDSQLELSAIITDGRPKNGSEQPIDSIIGRLFFHLQLLIERKIFGAISYNVGTQTQQQLKALPTLSLSPTRSGTFDDFSKSDVDLIKEYQLDLILKFGFGDLKGNILHATKHGIWFLSHSGFMHKSTTLLGFWEIISNQEVVTLSIIQLAEKNRLVDKAWYNKHWSFLKTKRLALEASVVFLLKNIRLLARGKSSLFAEQPSHDFYTTEEKTPSTASIFKYVCYFFKIFAKKLYYELRYKALGVRVDCWTLFMGDGHFMESDLSKLHPVSLPKGEYWADPFLFTYQEEDYIFFENYSYQTKKGKISCGKIESGKLVDVKDVLDFGYHLSYPNIFQEDGAIFMMPETGENERLEIYKCIKFPNEWALFATAFEGEKVFDAFFYEDEGNKWLFLNKQSSADAPSDCELYIYQVDSLKLERIIPHEQNPVIINAKTARNGGVIFEYDNNLYRPSQANKDGIYGRALNVNKIKKISLQEYEEETVLVVEPDFKPALVSTHHLHQTQRKFVIDAAYAKM